MIDMDVVGKTIKRIRKEKHMTQEVLSGFAGIARTHLTMIENGQKMINLTTFFKICNALNIDSSELMKQVECEYKNLSSW